MFGHVIDGQEVVKAVERLQVDENSRPLVDVSIASCGELVLQVKPKGIPVLPLRFSVVFPGELGSREQNVWVLVERGFLMGQMTLLSHTHKHLFNGLFSRITWVGWYQKDKPFWILLKQR